MKRRAFIQTILGALAAIGVGTKLVGRQSVEQNPMTMGIDPASPDSERFVTSVLNIGKEGQVLYLTPNGYEWRDL